MASAFYGARKEGVKQDKMIGVLLVQTLYSSVESYPGVCVLAEPGEADVDQPAADSVHHILLLLFLLFCK